MPTSLSSCPFPVVHNDNAVQSRVELLNRLLNDPDIPLQPHRIWALADEIANSAPNDGLEGDVERQQYHRLTVSATG
jgi:hypothetical protein